MVKEITLLDIIIQCVLAVCYILCTPLVALNVIYKPYLFSVYVVCFKSQRVCAYDHVNMLWSAI